MRYRDVLDEGPVSRSPRQYDTLLLVAAGLTSALYLCLAIRLSVAAALQDQRTPTDPILQMFRLASCPVGVDSAFGQFR
jgi:hypothetical protein